MWLLSTLNMASTKEGLNLCIAFNLNLSSHLWLEATILDSTELNQKLQEGRGCAPLARQHIVST